MARRQTRPAGGAELPSDEDLDEFLEELRKPKGPRRAPPELGPDPPMAGNDREMALDAVRNLARTIQLLAWRMRRFIELDPEQSFVVHPDAAKSLAALQKVWAGMAEGYTTVQELAQAGAAGGMTEEDLELVRGVLDRAEAHARRRAAEDEAKNTPQ